MFLGWMIWWTLLLISAVTKLTVSIRYGRVGENDLLVVEVSAWFGLIRLRYEIPVIKWTTSGGQPAVVAEVKGRRKQSAKEKRIDLQQIKTSLKRYRSYLHRFVDVRPVMNQMLRHVRCTALEWHTVLGTGDAAGTGALAGAAWGVKSVVVGTISRHVTLHAVPRFSVQPVWNEARLGTQFRCVFHFRIGHLMIAGMRLTLLRLKAIIARFRAARAKHDPYAT